MKLAVLMFAAVCAQAQTQMAEQVFKNVQVLKGIPVDEFMGTMGVFSAALGMSCEDCHAANDSKWENYALDTSPRKKMARTMVSMMQGINKSYFGGRQVVTCYACHRGGEHPKVTPSLTNLYGGGAPDEPEDIVRQAPNQPSAEAILDKYIQALGGAQKAGGITSIAAKGTSSGYGPESAPRPVEIYAKAPAQRVTIIHTDNGDSTTTYDGSAGWIAAPLRPVPVLALSGNELAGLRLDAELGFPSRIKQSLGNWKVGFPITVGAKDLQVVQGTSAAGALATLYFDPDTGLLTRVIRYAASVVGRLPTQIDYSDYREVAGVKMPFNWTVTWLDGRENFEMSEIRANVAIEAGKFAKPAAPKAK